MRSICTVLASFFLAPVAFAGDPAGGYYQTHWRTFDAIVSNKPIEAPMPAKSEPKPAAAALPKPIAKPSLASLGKPVAVETPKPATIVQAAALLPAKPENAGPRAWIGKPKVPAPKLLPTLGIPQ